MTQERYPFEKVVLSYTAAIVVLAFAMHVLAMRSPFREWLGSGTPGAGTVVASPAASAGRATPAR